MSLPWREVSGAQCITHSNDVFDTNFVTMETSGIRRYDPSSRAAGARRIIFWGRSSCIPKRVETKGLTNEMMMYLPAMHLADLDPIEIKRYLGDRDKWLQNRSSPPRIPTQFDEG
jgi:hypothetical protein